MPKKMKARMPKMPKMPKMPSLKLPKLNTPPIAVIVIFVLAVVVFAIWGRLPTNQENFDANSNDPSVALFYAPWCGHCKTLKPIWKQVEDNFPNVCKSIDCDADPKMAEKFGVKGFPTIKYLPQGFANPDSAEEYQGERTLEALTTFVKSKVGGIPSRTSENPMPMGGQHDAS